MPSNQSIPLLKILQLKRTLHRTNRLMCWSHKQKLKANRRSSKPQTQVKVYLFSNTLNSFKILSVFNLLYFYLNTKLKINQILFQLKITKNILTLSSALLKILNLFFTSYLCRIKFN